MPQSVPVGEELLQIVREGLDEALHILADGEGLVPFMVTSKTMVMLADMTTRDEMVQLVHSTMRDVPLDRAVLVYDGHLTVKGTRFAAVLIEAFNKEQSFQFAQLYRAPQKEGGIVGTSHRVERLGNLKYLAGNTEYL